MRGLLLVFSLHVGRGNPARDSSARYADRWFAPDKAQHFFMAAFIQASAYGALRTTGLGRRGSVAGATALTSAVSVGKELWDRTHQGDPSLEDLTWDAVGMAAATVLVARTRR
ncbi:MAG: hypothetical protein ACHQWU_06425 [Gemmatimonadales bacterium]|jgi:uncharacterized protein YfiM (DUF2279 family)